MRTNGSQDQNCCLQHLVNQWYCFWTSGFHVTTSRIVTPNFKVRSFCLPFAWLRCWLTWAISRSAKIHQGGSFYAWNVPHLGDVKAPWSQAVSIQGGTELNTIRETHQGWTIPGLHDTGEIFVKVLKNAMPWGLLELPPTLLLARIVGCGSSVKSIVVFQFTKKIQHCGGFLFSVTSFLVKKNLPVPTKWWLDTWELQVMIWENHSPIETIFSKNLVTSIQLTGASELPELPSCKSGFYPAIRWIAGPAITVVTKGALHCCT